MDRDLRRDVVIAGGGPVGLFLAAELRVMGLSPLVIERLTEPDPRKNDDDRGLTGRTIRTLELRGLTGLAVASSAAAQARLREQAAAQDVEDLPPDAREMLERFGRDPDVMKGHFGGLPLLDRTGELSDLPGVTMVMQGDFEQALAGHAAKLGVEVWRGADVADVLSDETGADTHGVNVRLSDGRSVRTAWLVGCDGGRSTVRQRAGFDFPGTPPSMVARIATVELADPDALPPGLTQNAADMLMFSPPPGQTMVMEYGQGDSLHLPAERHAELTAEEFQAALRRVSGTQVTVAGIHNGFRATDNARQATTYRRGRVLLAGDAAHVHSPVGGQGLNLGLQDAANLGWKLALVARGLAPEGLLDTYTTERHPVGARVLRNARAQTVLMRPDPQSQALRELLGEILEQPQATRYVAEMVSGAQIHYQPDQTAHPLVGSFTPNLPLTRPEGVERLVDLLHTGHGVLLDLAGAAWLQTATRPWADRVDLVTATSPEAGDLTGLLIRPDGYLAWAASHNRHDPEGVRAALTRWFGPAATPA